MALPAGICRNPVAGPVWRRAWVYNESASRPILTYTAASARVSRQRCRLLLGLRPVQVACGSTAVIDIYKCRLLQPVMVASAFSRCHCSGPRPWVQPHRR